MIQSLIAEASLAGARQEACAEALNLSVRTLERWKKQQDTDPTQTDRRTTVTRPIPANALSEAEQEEVIALATSPAWRDRPPKQIVPALSDLGCFIASESTFYRLLRKKGMLVYRSAARPGHPRPQSWVATGPNQIWSWDITYLPMQVKGKFYYLYLFLDVWSRKIIGWEIHDEESMEHSSHLVARLVAAQGYPPKLVLHADNGGAMRGVTMLAKLQELGMVPSFSRPGVSDDNPYSESLFRTLKYCPAYPTRPFTSLEAARNWVLQFVVYYNNEHLHSGIGYVTPESRHAGTAPAILEQRQQVYRDAQARHPERWSRGRRTWTSPDVVYLNPTSAEKASRKK